MKPIERIASEVIITINNEKPNLGTVVAVGPGLFDKKGRRRPLDIKVNDTIRYGTSQEYLSYPEYWEKGEKFLVLQEADVCFVAE